MSIYLTKQVQFATKVEAFEIRGLPSQVSVRACDAGVVPLSICPPEARIRYDYLHDELPARIKKEATAYTSPPKLVSVLHKFDKMHFEIPTLLVEMKTGGEVLNAFGLFETGTSKIGLYAGKPTTESLRNILALGLDLYSTVPAGNVNLSGYIAFVHAWRGINAFMMMGGGYHEGDPQQQFIDSEVHKSLEADKVRTNEIQLKRARDLEVIQEDPEDTSGGFFYTKASTFFTGSALSCALAQIPIAEPTTKGVPGLIFPFFREMLDGDPDTPFNIFFRLFRFTIVDNEEALAEHVIVLRRGFRYLASTIPGRIIQHIYFGMNLTIELGGRLTLIRNGGEYAGFVVEGENLKVLYKNRVRTSLGAEEMGIQLASLNTHSKAAGKIHEYLVEISRIDGEMETITVQDIIQNPRKLREMVQARPGGDIESIREVLGDNVADLKYDQTYWEISSKNITRFLMALSQNQDIEDEPMYLHMDVLTNRSSKVLSYLSVFGHQAPSIFHGNTTKRILAVGEDDPNLAVVSGKRAVPYIPFVKKGLIAAGADWVAARRAKAFKYVGPKKTGAGGGFSSARDRHGVITNPDFDAFYVAMRMWMYTEEERPAQPRGKKRAQGDDDDEAMETEQPKKKAIFRFM